MDIFLIAFTIQLAIRILYGHRKHIFIYNRATNARTRPALVSNKGGRGWWFAWVHNGTEIMVRKSHATVLNLVEMERRLNWNSVSFACCGSVASVYSFCREQQREGAEKCAPATPIGNGKSIERIRKFIVNDYNVTLKSFNVSHWYCLDFLFVFMECQTRRSKTKQERKEAEEEEEEKYWT